MSVFLSYLIFRSRETVCEYACDPQLLSAQRNTDVHDRHPHCNRQCVTEIRVRRTGALLHWQPVQLRFTSSIHSARAHFASDYVTYLIAGFYIAQVYSVIRSTVYYICCLQTEDYKPWLLSILHKSVLKEVLLYDVFIFLSWHFYQRPFNLI